MPRTLDEDQFDDDPAPEDFDRLDHENAYCPDCGAEVWDSAEVCPKCFAYLGGNTAPRRPFHDRLRQWWIALVAIVLILAMLALLM